MPQAFNKCYDKWNKFDSVGKRKHCVKGTEGDENKGTYTQSNKATVKEVRFSRGFRQMRHRRIGKGWDIVIPRSVIRRD